MKALIVSIIFTLVCFTGVDAQDKISVSKKDAFNSLTKTDAVSKIILTDFKDGLPSAAKQFLDNNNSFITYSVSNNELTLQVNIEKNEKVIYLKLFSQLGIHQVEVLKGKDKGLYTIEDFLNKYNL